MTSEMENNEIFMICNEEPSVITSKLKVADLRNVIHKKLDLKTPIGNPSSSKPFWAKNIKVYEPNGFNDPHVDKHMMGRVLEGPVNPRKFFQGVPPPSYNQVKSQEMKPPVPPSKSLQQQNVATLKQTCEATSSWKPMTAVRTYKTPFDASMDVRIFGDEIDDSASIISSCISTFGESSEVAGFSAAAEQRKLYEQYRNDLLEKQDFTVDTNDINRKTESMHSSITGSCKVPFGHSGSESHLPTALFNTDDLTPFGHATPKLEPTNKTSNGKVHGKSMDLESSQMLIKPKSPAPYSTNSNVHYGTLRKQHKPVLVEEFVSESRSARELSFPGNAQENDDKYAKVDVSEQTCSNRESANDTIEQQFEKSGVMENIRGNIVPAELELEKSGTAAQLELSGEVNLPRYTAPTGHFESKKIFDYNHDDGALSVNDTVSHWYRNMFKQMHKPSFAKTQHGEENCSTGTKNREGRIKQLGTLPGEKIEQVPFIGNTTMGNTFDDLVLKTEHISDNIKKRNNPHTLPLVSPLLPETMYSLAEKSSGYAQEEPSSDSVTANPLIPIATAIYNFEPKTPRELALNKGDIVRVLRNVDAFWIEGERNGKSGIFPSTYVQIHDFKKSENLKLRAIYPFTARNENELSLKKGEVLLQRRTIDSNWLEGSNHTGRVGIFPSCYVEPLSEDPEIPRLLFPDRPKTPKLPENSDRNVILTKSNTGKVRFDDSNSVTFSFEPFTKPSSTGITNAFVDNGLANEHNSNPIFTGKETDVVQKKNEILMQAASLIPERSEMYRVIYSYQPQKEDELKLIPNDIIFVVEKCDDGWFIGTSLSSGEFGIFPGNYVKRH